MISDFDDTSNRLGRVQAEALDAEERKLTAESELEKAARAELEADIEAATVLLDLCIFCCDGLHIEEEDGGFRVCCDSDDCGGRGPKRCSPVEAANDYVSRWLPAMHSQTPASVSLRVENKEMLVVAIDSDLFAGLIHLPMAEVCDAFSMVRYDLAKGIKLNGIIGR
jgi:hypothetical protein